MTDRNPNTRMKMTGSAALALFAAAGLFLGGCQSDAATGAGIGAGLGAIGGAVIGHNSGRHGGEGAAIGAAAGALGGYLIGNESDKAKMRDRHRHDPYYSY